MKKAPIAALVVLSIILGSGVLSAQNSIVGSINQWFENKQYTYVIGIMTDDVKCTILGRDYNSKTEASRAINDTFRGKTIERYQLIHSGDKGNSTFMVAKIKFQDAEYRINILLSDNKIIEFRME